MTHPFKHSRQALGWANNKTTDLEILTTAYYDGNTTVMRVEPNPNGRSYDVIASFANPMPDSIGRAAGEAVQYLRSALDYAVCDIVEPLDSKAAERIMFPIVTDEEAFENQLKRLKIQTISSDLADFLRGVKPYGGGDEDLFLLNELNRSGKHRRPTAMGSAAVTSGRHSMWFERVCALETPARGDPEKGIKLFTIPDRDAKFKYQTQIRGTVTFSNLPKLGGEPSVRVLKRYHERVKNIVDDMERRFG